MEGMKVWYYVCGWLLSTTAIIGNGFVVYLIATRKKLHTTTNCFVASLCLADCMVGFTLFPPLFACDIWLLCNKNITTPLRWFFLHVSITNICTMAAERYFAIVLPLKYVAMVTWTKVSFCVAVAWAIPVFAYMIPFTILYVDGRKVQLQYFFIFSVVVLIFLPMVLLGFITARILLITQKLSGEIDAQLSSVRYNHTPSRTNPSPERNSLHRYSARVIVFVVGLFFLCYSIDIYFIFCDTFEVCGFPSKMRYVKHILLITNSAVNPFAYAFFKRDVRNAMKTMFLHRRRLFCCLETRLAVPHTKSFTLFSNRCRIAPSNGCRTNRRATHHFMSSLGTLA